MKKLVIVLLFAIICSLHASAQTAFYYHQGKKIPLTLNANKVCVSIPKDCDEIIERFRANAHVLTMIKDEAFDIFVIAQTDYEKLTSLEFWAEDVRSVILTSSYFTENGKEVFATPYLNVRLKKEEDMNLLSSYAEKSKLKIVGHSPSMPLWYILTVTPDNDHSPLECANLLWESGEFAASIPDLCDSDEEINSVNLTNSIDSPQETFDLQGRRIPEGMKPQRGVYIREGKKFVVK